MITHEAGINPGPLVQDEQLQAAEYTRPELGRFGRLGLRATGVLLGSAGQLLAPAMAHAGPVLNYPHGSVAQEQVIYNGLANAVSEATPGSFVGETNPTMSMPMARALIAAKDRGDRVQVVMANHGPLGDNLSPAAQKLVKKLGTDIHSDSFVHICSHACNSPVPGSIMHDKELILSDVHGQPETWETSTDLTPFQGPHEYNNAYFTNNRRYYHRKKQWFESLLDNKRQGFSGHFSSGNLIGYDFPRPASTAKHNVFTQALAPVECQKNGHSTHTHVDEITSRISPLMKKSLVKRWATLEQQGCDVRVVFDVENTPPALIKAVIKAHIPYRFSNETSDGVKYWSHDKVIIIHGEYGGKRLWTVFSGSVNPNMYEIRDCDESWMRIKNSHSAYDAFDKQFNTIWRLGNKQPLPAGQKVVIVR